MAPEKPEIFSRTLWPACIMSEADMLVLVNLL